MIDKEMAIRIVNKIGSYGDIVLRSDLQEVAKFIDYQDKEIERLNNIINELEKELKVDYEKYKNCDFESIIAQIDSYWLNRIKDLKELKENKQ